MTTLQSSSTSRATHSHNWKPERYEVDPTTGCWNWLLRVDDDGYAKVWHEGRTRKAHKVYYEEKHGPVKVGLQLDHTCRNRRCVNPDHLEPVTRRVNVRRGLAAKLTEGQVAFIRKNYQPRKNGGVYRFAKEFNVTPQTIHLIVRGQTWL